MTDLVNPAATGGLDFGAILDKTLGVYQGISVARLERDTARYNAAGAAQFAGLHSSESPTALDAWNASMQANGLPRTTAAATSAGINPAFIYVGLAVAGAAILWKTLK